MNTKKISILLILLLAWAMNILAQTEKPQLTLVRNSYKELQGNISYLQPIVYKDKIYMGYKFDGGRYSTALVTFDGQNWTSSIHKDKDGKIVGDNYDYQGEAVIYQDLLFMVFKDKNKKKDVLAYTDGKTMKYLNVDADYINVLLATPDKLYIGCHKRYDNRNFLWTYDGKTVSKIDAYLPTEEDGSIYSLAYYKGKIILKGQWYIYTLTGNKLSDIRVNTSAESRHVIWQDKLYYLAKRPLKEPCRNKEGRYVKEGLRMLGFDGEKVDGVHYLAEKHTQVSQMKVIDENLYSTQVSCETGKTSFCVTRGNKRATAYTWAAADCRGDFIKYQNSIFVGYSYFNDKIDKYDNFLTSWTFDSNNKKDFKRIKDDYIYLDGKVQRVYVSYIGYPVVFKNELYLFYTSNGNDYGKETYLMKYTP